MIYEIPGLHRGGTVLCGSLFRVRRYPNLLFEGCYPTLPRQHGCKDFHVHVLLFVVRRPDQLKYSNFAPALWLPSLLRDGTRFINAMAGNTNQPGRKAHVFVDIVLLH